MSLLGEDFNVFRIVVWHCMNLIDGRIRLIPYFDLLIIRLLKVALMGSSSHCLIYFETMLSRLSIIQVLLIIIIIIKIIIIINENGKKKIGQMERKALEGHTVQTK